MLIISKIVKIKRIMHEIIWVLMYSEMIKFLKFSISSTTFS